MSRPAELIPPPSVVGEHLDRRQLEERGYKRCEHCRQLLPLSVSRCRRRRCPAYSPIWARDTMRKIRVNLSAYGGRVSMLTLTAPGEAAGLVWDRSQCTHREGVRCDGRKGCRVVPEAAAIWNEDSRRQWSELNRICKQRADRVLKRNGYSGKGSVLTYTWELQKRGVWHLHFVVGMETAVERVWATEYAHAMRSIGGSKGFGWVDVKPLRSPRPAERVGGYLSKYLAKWREDGTFELSETVKSAGRTLLNYVSRTLTAKSGCTMRALRNVRIVWAWREGLIAGHGLSILEFNVAVSLLEDSVFVRGP